MSKVVFVGNVPYNMGEEQLIDVFKSVGQVVGFRDTGKPRGYGFCEFADHDTAMSAVRNLNNTDVGGRPLRIDLADSDPFLEGKTTVRGELLDGGVPGPSEPRSQWRTPGDTRHDSVLAGLPSGIPVPQGASALDYISHTLAGMQPNRLMEVLAQMKAYVITHPEQARTLLIGHPQLAYALFQSLLLNKIVDPAILQRMLAATSGGGSAAPPPPPPARPPIPPPHLRAGYQSTPVPVPGYTQPPMQPNIPSLVPPPMSAPPMSAMFSHHQPPQHPSMHPGMPGMPPISSYYGVPQPVAPPMAPPPQVQTQPPAQQPAAAASTSAISEDQRSMLMQVFNLTQEQINAFPETERAAIQQLRTQYSQYMG